MVNKKDIISQLRDNKKTDIISRGARSIQWLNKKIIDVLSGTKKTSINRSDIGKMFVYEYNAKYGETLPIWDKYPLIILLDINKIYMLGLNLHYIPYTLRQNYIEALLRGNSQDINKLNKILITWAKVKNKKYSKNIIRVYLKKNIKSPPIEIPVKEWINAIHLPTPRFIVN